ncbi:hypothetical protein OAO55_03095 [Bacteroidales bacterium]|nr:hypothetical protein [Bacteroidales bacterium]
MASNDFEKLREQLDKDNTWPQPYMFKFIVPNNDGKLEQVKSYLPQDGKLSYKHTKSLKYISITCVAIMKSSNEIIEISKKASSISGVMTL